VRTKVQGGALRRIRGLTSRRPRVALVDSIFFQPGARLAPGRINDDRRADPRTLAAASLLPAGRPQAENLPGAGAPRPPCRDLGAGRLLFKEGDTEKRPTTSSPARSTCLRTDGSWGTVKAGTPEARHPVAPILPRRCAARVATERVEYLSIDSDLLDVLITWTRPVPTRWAKLHAGPRRDDWMTLLLQSRGSTRSRRPTWQAVFMRMQRVDYVAGDTVVRQGTRASTSTRSCRDAVW